MGNVDALSLSATATTSLPNVPNWSTVTSGRPSALTSASNDLISASSCARDRLIRGASPNLSSTTA